MHDGMVVQSGTPVELFENPRHTFVGHFIGSPGMNLLPATVSSNQVYFKNNPVVVRNAGGDVTASGDLEIGIRPEFVKFGTSGIPVEVVKVNDIGRDRIVVTQHDSHIIKLIVPESETVPDGGAHLQFDPARTTLYTDGWLYGDNRS